MLMLSFLLFSSLVWGGLIWLAARALQRGSVSGRARQWIWRGATVLLLAPWIAAPLVSAFGWGLAANEGYPAHDAFHATLMIEPATMAPVVESAGFSVAAAPVAVDAAQVILLVLAAGWLVRFVIAQLAARSLLGIIQYAREAGPGPARNALTAWGRRLRMRRTPRLLVVAETVSPFSFGILRPTICLPEGLEQRLKPEALDMVLAHESTHVARGDGWLRPLERVTADILWFNPFAWLMRRELDVARELACDEAVIDVARDRKVYARTLRDIAGFTVCLPAAIPAASMSLAGGSLVLRVTRALSAANRKPARVAMASACVLALVAAPLAVGQVMLVTPAPEAPPAPPAPPAFPQAALAFVQPPEAPEAPAATEIPDVPEFPEAPEAPAAAELSRDGTVRASFPARVVTATGDASSGYAVRLEGTGSATSCTAQLNGLGSITVGPGQTLAEGDAVGRRSEGRQMRLSVSCANGDTPRAMVFPPAAPLPPTANVIVGNGAVAAPVAPVAPLSAPRPAAAPQPPTPVAPVAPVVAPLPVHQIANAPHAIVVAPARPSSSYGDRVHPISGERLKHEGIDIAAKRGVEIHAPGPGRVVFAGALGNYGNVVDVDVSGYALRFAQLEEIKVRQGQAVAAGTVVGTMGSSGQATGPHLHLEVRKDGQTVDPAAVSGLVIIEK